MIYAVAITALIALAALATIVLVSRQLTKQARDLGEHLSAIQSRAADDLDRAYHCQQAETRDLMNRVMEFAEVRHTMMMSAKELREQQRELLEDDNAPKLYFSDIPDDEDAFDVAADEYGVEITDQEAVASALHSFEYRYGPGAAD